MISKSGLGFVGLRDEASRFTLRVDKFKLETPSVSYEKGIQE